MKSMKTFAFSILLFSLMLGCFEAKNAQKSEITKVHKAIVIKEFVNAVEEPIVNIYSQRDSDVDKDLYQAFEKETGIKVHVVKENSDTLLIRLDQEKKDPQSDLLFTTGYNKIQKAVSMNLLDPFASDTLLAQTWELLRDPDHYWYALSSMLKVIVIDKDFKGVRPKSYWDLSKPQYREKILTNSGKENTNIAWVASLISMWGEDKTREFLKGFVSNFSKDPEGNDKTQISDIYAQKGSISVVNSYYLGQMINDVDPAENKASQAVVIIYPEDGVHQNISGFGLIKNAKHQANALKLLEFLTSKESQTRLTNENYEYPVNRNVEPTDIFLKWGKKNFKLQDVNLQDWGSKYEDSIKLITEAGWK